MVVPFAFVTVTRNCRPFDAIPVIGLLLMTLDVGIKDTDEDKYALPGPNSFKYPARIDSTAPEFTAIHKLCVIAIPINGNSLSVVS